MKIFYKNKTPRHTDYYFLGYRFLRKSNYTNRQLHDEIMDVFDYVRACADISKMPPAQGLARQRQLGMLKILKTVSKFCKHRNIKFWLDYGTLLGAVRHKGFIPWDDDADISMLRDDYEKFVDLFNLETPDKKLFAEWYCMDGIYNMIKIRHKDIPFIWLDIFPCDFGYKKLSLAEAIEQTTQIKSMSKKYNKKLKYEKDINKLKQFFKDEKEKLPFIGQNNGKPETVFYGLDFYHYREDTVIFDYEMFFPLKEAEFEGENFPVVNETETYLTYIFGDYQCLPSKITRHKEGEKTDLCAILALKEYLKSDVI